MTPVELAAIFAFSIGGSGTRCFLGEYHNGSGRPVVCGLGVVTPSAYDVKVCPGQSLRNHRWRGKLTCVYADDLKECAGSGLPFS